MNTQVVQSFYLVPFSVADVLLKDLVEHFFGVIFLKCRVAGAAHF